MQKRVVESQADETRSETDKVAVETRLTAEQFYDAHREFEHVPTLARKHFFEFAEAYAAGLREEIERLKADHQVEIDRYRNTIDLMSRRENGEVWYWADDGEDHPETLACPALIQPDVVRRFVAAKAEAAALREHRETFVEHTCTGSALCKECGKALSAAPERGKDGKL